MLVVVCPPGAQLYVTPPEPVSVTGSPPQIAKVPLMLGVGAG